jgi:hypothetical protein
MELIGLLVLGIAAGVRIYAESRKERDEPTRVEIEEYSDWSWPARRVGPPARAHLGRRP